MSCILEICRPVMCLRNPCEGLTCRRYPGARCVPDYCDRCNAHFYIGRTKVYCGGKLKVTVNM